MNIERLCLQVCVFVGGCVPISAGMIGALFGARLTGDTLSADGDSHVRYLSGLLLAIGLLFWSTIPRIEEKTARFQLLTLIVAIGGISRLLGFLLGPVPSRVMMAAAAMEVIVTPVLCLWQMRMRTLVSGSATLAAVPRRPST
jgi:uncharacterized protein DUF4345